jgi:hypothetical protein
MRLIASLLQPYKRRSQSLKEQREREHAAYMRTLTPDDIKRENAFRTSQRKAGKSRKGNIKDPNAPKKPLSAYFMFLQAIRSDPGCVLEVFGNETETTKQSVLAAAKWRSMTDEERKVRTTLKNSRPLPCADVLRSAQTMRADSEPFFFLLT